VRRFLERHAPVLVAAILVCAAVVPTLVPGPAEAESDRVRPDTERPVAAPDPTSPFRLDRAGLEDRLRDAFARLAFVNSLPADPVPGPTGGGTAPAAGDVTASGRCGGDVECFLACTRAHESDSAGGYAAVGGGGAYRGAYQFSQGTWDAAVAGAGWAEYAGLPADQAPPEIQDAAAAHLYSVSGNAHWGGLC